MDLIIDEMMELQHVFPADRDLIVQFFTGTAIIEVRLRTGRKACCLQGRCEVFISAAVEDRGRDMDTGLGRFRHAVFFEIIAAVDEALLHFFILRRADTGCHRRMDLFAEHVAGPGKMDLQDLSDVHSGRYAQWVQYQIDRTAIRGERHIFDRHDAGAYALVAVTACHFIAFTDLTFLRDVDADELVHARCQLITVFTGEDLDIDDLAEFAVRHTQGGITDFSFFVTEDRTQ